MALEITPIWGHPRTCGAKPQQHPRYSSASPVALATTRPAKATSPSSPCLLSYTAPRGRVMREGLAARSPMGD